MADVRIIPNRYQLHIVIWIHLAALTAMIANVLEFAGRDADDFGHSSSSGSRLTMPIAIVQQSLVAANACFLDVKRYYLDALGPRSGQAAHPTGQEELGGKRHQAEMLLFAHRSPTFRR